MPHDPPRHSPTDAANADPATASNPAQPPREWGHRAWFEAAANGKVDSLSAMLSDGWPIGKQTFNGLVAALVAARYGSTHALRLLVDSGCDLEVREPGEQMTPLLMATLHGKTECALLLADSGADIEARNCYGQTPLMLCCEMNRAALAAELMRRGACLGARDHRGFDAIALSARGGNLECVEILAKAGASLDEPGKDGRTLLVWAASEALPIVPILARHGASLDARDARGRTAAMLVAMKGRDDGPAALSVLISAGCDLSLADSFGDNVAIHAVVQGSVECLALALAAGCDVDKRNGNGHSACDYALDRSGPTRKDGACLAAIEADRLRRSVPHGSAKGPAIRL